MYPKGTCGNSPDYIGAGLESPAHLWYTYKLVYPDLKNNNSTNLLKLTTEPPL